MKILLVDDDTISLKGMEKYLSDDGHVIHTSTDGFEALKMIEQHDLDLIIADIAMPRLSGFELLNYLKNKIDSNIPVILVSALEQQSIMMTAFKLGADNFLNKPLNFDELLYRVQSFEKIKL